MPLLWINALNGLKLIISKQNNTDISFCTLFFQMSAILLIWLFMQIVLSANGEDKMNSLETK